MLKNVMAGNMQIKTKVECVLRDDPKARDSDKYLIREVWKRFHPGVFETFNGRDYINDDKFFDLPSTESIRRTRQKFHQEGKYLPSEAVAKERGRLQETMKSEMPTEDWGRAVEDIT